MALKRGKVSLVEAAFIRENANSLTIKQMAVELNRSENFVEDFCIKERLTYTGMSEEVYDDTVLRQKLESRPYWEEVQAQFTQDELKYFSVTWVRIMKQFREDTMYSEELQVKQWITLEILCNRVMKDRKRALEQVDRLDADLNRIYNIPVEHRTEEDLARLVGLETEVSMLRNSLGSYTNEHTKLLDKIKDIQKDLKAARSDRIKRIEDSKTSFAGFIRSLEDEEMRAKAGEDMEVLRLAKNECKNRLAAYHTYEDGNVDQPFLTPETVKDDDYE